MAEIYMIRHGKTEMNDNDLVIGHLNPSLISSKSKEIKSIANKLRKVKFDKIFSSDLIRASQTAEGISNVLKYKGNLSLSKELREIDYGEFSGNAKKDVKIKYPPYHNDIKFVNPKGESFKQMYNRIIKFLKRIMKDNKRYLIITHAGCIRAAYSFFNDEEFQDNINMKISHEIILKCVYDGKNKKAEILNN